MASITGKAVYLGTFIHSLSLDKLEFLHDAAVFVDELGSIVTVEKDIKDEGAARELFSKLGWAEEGTAISFRACKGEQFFFPGFIGISQSYFTLLTTPPNYLHFSSYHMTDR
jgi:guanine deaminase